MNPRTLMTTLTTLIAALFLTMGPSQAHAQTSNLDSRDQELLTTTTIAMAEVLLIPMMMMSVAGSASSSSSTLMLMQGARGKYRAALDQYATHHRQELEDTLAMGAGPAVADLAAILELDADEARALPLKLRRGRDAMLTAMNLPAGSGRGEAMLQALEK